MAKEIPGELKTFKEKVEPGIGTMRSTVSQISSGIEQVKSASSAAKAALQEAYSGNTGASQAIAKFDSINQIVDSIKSDIESTINGAIGQADSLIAKIKELETKQKEIIALESSLSTEKNKKEPDSSTISSIQSKLNDANEEFDKGVTEAQDMLAALKGLDKSITSAQEAAGASGTALDTYSQYLGNLKYGSFIKDVFHASTMDIPYYLYVPDYGTTVTGLPVFMYIHGGRKADNYVGSWETGVTKKLMERQITPSGIVISPYCKNFDSEATLVALRELTDDVVKRYHADTNRISVGGASYGAITAYQMVNANPGYYSACVPIAGYDNVTSAFRDVKVWALHGVRDLKQKGSRTDYNVAKQKMNEINQIGGSAILSDMPGGHTHSQDKAFEGSYTSPDGKVENPLEWAFRQTKNKDKTYTA